MTAADSVGAGLIGRWSPGIGDPTFVGWFTTAAYLATAWLCRRVALRTPTRNAPSRHERSLWKLLQYLFLLLGINKQADFQSLFFEVGRLLVHAEGWYAFRKLVKRAFVLTLGVSALVAALVLWRLTRRSSLELHVATLGAVLLLGFVVMRAALFAHVSQVLGASYHFLIELAGIGTVAAAGRSRLRKLGTR